MKVLSVAIPCYNSEEYMRKAIESLLPGGEDIEILIVNDGSKDNTQAIAEEYAEKYPTIVRAISQENGAPTFKKIFFPRIFEISSQIACFFFSKIDKS